LFEFESIPLLCDLKKDLPKITDKCISAIKATNKSVFIADNMGFSSKFSIPSQTIIQKHGYLHNDTIFCYETTECGKWVFTSDGEGILKQWNCDTMDLQKNYGRLMDCEIKDIAIAGDSVFIGDLYGALKEISITEEKVTKNYGKIHKSGIWSLRATRDGEYLFTSDAYGYLQQWSIRSQTCVKNYGYIHDAGIRKIDVSWDNKYLFTADRQGGVKQWEIKEKKEVKNFGRVFDCEVLSIKTSPKFLFVSSVKGGLKQFNIETREMVQDFGKIHSEGAIQSITVTPNAKLLFTSDDKGNMKQFRINDEYILKKKHSIYEEIEPIIKPKKTPVSQVQKQEKKISDVTSIDSSDIKPVVVIQEKVVVKEVQMPNVDGNVVSAVKSKVNILEMKVDKMEEKMNSMEKKIDLLLNLVEKKK